MVRYLSFLPRRAPRAGRVIVHNAVHPSLKISRRA